MTLDEQLERCKPWIEDALSYSGGTHLFEDVVECVKLGKMQLWPAERGCAVTEILVYPRKKVMHIFLAGGELDQFFDMHESAVAWAKAQGCSGISLAGRKGWTRVMQSRGWKELFTTVGLEI
jgi:hypothetical protein